jgi:hypothetical protein
MESHQRRVEQLKQPVGRSHTPGLVRGVVKGRHMPFAGKIIAASVLRIQMHRCDYGFLLCHELQTVLRISKRFGNSVSRQS